MCTTHRQAKNLSRYKNGSIKESDLLGSVHFDKISERISSFETIKEIVQPGNTKIIVFFDDSIINTAIHAQYYLYKRVGSALEGNVTYYNLFIGYNQKTDEYFPNTYIVEHSNNYIKNQLILDCEIQYT